MAYKIPMLSFPTDLETKAVMKKVAAARSALAELKGAATGIPNENILISTLSLKEANGSSVMGSNKKKWQSRFISTLSCKEKEHFLYSSNASCKVFLR